MEGQNSEGDDSGELWLVCCRRVGKRICGVGNHVRQTEGEGDEDARLALQAHLEVRQEGGGNGDDKHFTEDLVRGNNLPAGGLR